VDYDFDRKGNIVTGDADDDVGITLCIE